MYAINSKTNLIMYQEISSIVENIPGIIKIWLLVSLFNGLVSMVLKYILKYFNDYILTPPATEQRRKSKLEFYRYMFCLPFLPRWASMGDQSALPEDDDASAPISIFNCPIKSCQHEWFGDTIGQWDTDLPGVKNSTEDNIDFCRLKCPGCQEVLVQCRYCTYNFQLEDKGGNTGKERRTQESYVRKKMRDHMRHKSGHARCDYIHPFFSMPSAEGEVDFGEGMDCYDQDEWADVANQNNAEQTNHGNIINDPTNELLERFGMLIEPTITEKEEEDANVYTSQFTGTSDLNPNTPGEEADEEEDDLVSGGNNYHLNQSNVTEDQAFTYSDFHFFDTRTEEEKVFRKGQSRQRICQNQIYFYQRYLLQLLCKDDGTGGFAGLVYRANIRNREDSSNPYHKRYFKWLQERSEETQSFGSTASNPIHELKQMHRMVNLLINLSDTEKREFLEFHKANMSLFNVASIKNDVQLQFPTEMADARSLILEGAHSIMKNLPVPRIFEISGHDNGLLGTNSSHSCASLLETIRIAAGHGTKFNFAYDPTRDLKCNFEGLNGTKAVEDLKRDVIEAMLSDNQSHDQIASTKIGYIYFWSDSFLRCFIKQRENSVWVVTVTICPPESEKTNGTNTFILALGKSGKEVDHRPVIEHYIKECQELMKGFDCYFGDSNTIGRMALAMLTWNADRPERQMITNTKQEGHHGKITGWSAKVSEKKFPACNACHRRRVLEMLGAEKDDLASCQCDQCLDWTLDPDQCDDKEKMFEKPPKDYPEDMHESDDLPEGREPGLSCLGPIKLSVDWMRKVLRTAYRGRRYWGWSKATTEAYLGSCNVGGAAGEKVESLARSDRDNGTVSNPSDIEPGIWNAIDVFSRFRMPDLPMHGLAHGIVPDSDNIIQTIFKNHGLCTRFYTMANKIIDDVASFRLDWCKVKTLPKAAWIGENSMAYMRLMSYLYGMFLPTVVEKIAVETVDNLKRFVNSLQALMSVLMSTTDPVERTTDNHMKLFMSSADLLHKGYGSLADKPKGKTDRVVDKLKLQGLNKILVEFGCDESALADESVPALRTRLHAITVGCLRSKCSDLNLDNKGKKEELQLRLFEHILGREGMDVDIDMGKEHDEHGGEGGASTEFEDPNGMCWNRGNWLSFLTNIPQQMKYLGPLSWIW